MYVVGKPSWKYHEFGNMMLPILSTDVLYYFMASFRTVKHDFDESEVMIHNYNFENLELD